QHKHPKRPMSSYLIWLNTSGRKSIMDMNPDLKTTEVAVKGGQMWREMSDDEKSVWKAMASVAMGQYQQQVKDWKTKSKNSVKSQGIVYKNGRSRPQSAVSRRVCYAEQKNKNKSR
ncbi:hypothetical protein KR009_009240, partial [Drosophila setifemur]